MSRKGIMLAALPTLLALGFFCSLIIHIRFIIGWRLSCIPLGAWPSSLDSHFYIASAFFVPLLYCTIFVVPVAILVCLLVSRWRYLALYLSVHFLLFVGFVLLTQLAPASFLQWWLD
jgi:hypothetical protein